MVYGLLIDVEFGSGFRAGGRLEDFKTGLQCCGAWQNSELGKEVRLVLDGKVERFQGIEGVEVLEGSEAIDRAVEGLFDGTIRYQVSSDALLVESIRQKGIDLSDISNEDPEFCAKCLHERGALGVVRIEPVLVSCAEMCKTWCVEG